MILMIDNYDSFVYNLVRYFEELKEEVKVIKNNKIDINLLHKELYKYDGIVISPGPKSPKEAGLSMDIIRECEGKIPVLGICLGHQCIGQYYGGNIVRGKRPYHGKISKIYHNNKGIFKGLKNTFMATRYHSLIIDENSINSNLEVIAKTADGTIMAIKHVEYPIFGVQFHPEAHLTEEGYEMLQNFIEECKRFKNNEYSKA